MTTVIFGWTTLLRYNKVFLNPGSREPPTVNSGHKPYLDGTVLQGVVREISFTDILCYLTLSESATSVFFSHNRCNNSRANYLFLGKICESTEKTKPVRMRMSVIADNLFSEQDKTSDMSK